MKYLADTDVLINHIRGRKYLDTQIIEDGLGISIISLAELLHGVYSSDNPQKAQEKVDALFALGVKVENLNNQIVDEYAQLKTNLEQAGQKLDEFDLLIGVTALVKNLILITGNLKHFKRIKGLKIAQ